MKEKRDMDYNGYVRRVIDYVRCSLIVVLDSLEQVKKIADYFLPPSGAFTANWSIVRIKDGFEKAENCIVAMQGDWSHY